MLIVTETMAKSLIGMPEAFDAVENVFSAMARGEARNFPVVREALGHADALYGFKSGFDASAPALGLKAGGYWPGNSDKGLTNHQSTVMLVDADTGQPTALVAGNYLTAARTAAASSVSIQHLARPDARVLGMLGAGFQSMFQMRAALRQRDFERVIGWNLHPEMLANLERTAAEEGVPFKAVSLDRLGAEADVIITITSSFEAMLKAEHVSPGTHIACMGTDTVGKQEVDPRLVAAARLFADEPAQAVQLGECQHAARAGLIAEHEITPIGAVINGDAIGRRDADEITLFDGTGVGLQDLAVACRAVELAGERGMARHVDLES
ncbi:iminosuccinate reductase BhcD [Salinisphaera sp. T31B1]|uniref:iminosuccinate reductase BhcD n=1 Tax=Salinisphaera sp. T31B1 TaxID=727963 RepID=UPI00333F8A3A